jgi:hypothetical protein
MRHAFGEGRRSPYGTAWLAAAERGHAGIRSVFQSANSVPIDSRQVNTATAGTFLGTYPSGFSFRYEVSYAAIDEVDEGDTRSLSHNDWMGSLIAGQAALAVA